VTRAGRVPQESSIQARWAVNMTAQAARVRSAIALVMVRNFLIGKGLN